MSELKTILDEKFGKDYVKLIGIGFELEKYEEFKQGKFFTGKIYIGNKEEIYKSVGFKKLGFFQCWGICSLCNKRERALQKQAKERNINYDFKGDGLQLGGILAITGDAEVILNFKQKTFADTPEPQDIIAIVEKYHEIQKTRL